MRCHCPLHPSIRKAGVQQTTSRCPTKAWPNAKGEQNHLSKQWRQVYFCSLLKLTSSFPAGKLHVNVYKDEFQKMYSTFHHWACHHKRKERGQGAFLVNFLFVFRQDLSFVSISQNSVWWQLEKSYLLMGLPGYSGSTLFFLNPISALSSYYVRNGEGLKTQDPDGHRRVGEMRHGHKWQQSCLIYQKEKGNTTLNTAVRRIGNGQVTGLLH